MPDPMTLSQCVAELKTIFTTLTEVDEMEESIRSQKGEIERLRRHIRDLRAESDSRGRLLREEQNRNSALRREIRDLDRKEERHRQATTIRAQQAEINMLRGERTQLIENHGSERQRWADDRKAQQDRITALNKSLDNALRANREHQVTISGLKGTINIYEEMIANATAVQAEKPKKKLRRALMQIDEWEEYAEKLNEQINERDERINELQRQLGICNKAGVDILDIVEQTRRNIDID